MSSILFHSNSSHYTQQPGDERKKKKEKGKEEEKDYNKAWMNEIQLLKDFDKSIYFDQAPEYFGI